MLKTKKNSLSMYSYKSISFRCLGFVFKMLKEGLKNEKI